MQINDIKAHFNKNRVGIIGENIEYIRYSILIPIIKSGDELNLLFEVRSKNLRNQPGEISFPGGKIEEGEDSLSASIRETSEELGISKDEIEILGNTELLITQHNKIIYPYIGAIKNTKKISPSMDEVDHLFHVPLRYFIQNKPIIKKAKVIIKPEDEFPYQDFNDSEYKLLEGTSSIYFYKYDKYVIWGLTAKILNNFIDIIRKPIE